MYVLGIETSCDETAVAVTKDNKILANSISSSVELHRDFGGVIPEIACRYHVEYINHVLRNALRGAGLGLDEIDLIAVTAKPGLVGALLVGISAAKALSLAKQIPLIGIDHLIAHLYAVFMNGKRVSYPFIGLVISGGHTSLFHVNDVDKYKLIGQTLDDAAGEAFDKVAKLLNLGYPGGPAIQARAKKGKIDKGLFRRSSFDKSLNFSFSGIKTAVLYHVCSRLKEKKIMKSGKDKTGFISTRVKNLTEMEINNIAASFQDAVTDVLTERAIDACRREGVGRLVLGGGVSANMQLRKKIYSRTAENGVRLFLPQTRLCLDNAAMIAGLGAALYRKGVKPNRDIVAQSTTVYN